MSQSRPKKVKKYQASEVEKNRLGIYKDISNPDLPAELWLEINALLPPAAKSQFAQVSKGTYALGYARENKHTFYNDPIRQRRKQVRDLLRYVVKEGNQIAAEELLKKDPTLLLETSHMADYAVGHTLDENGMLVCHPNPMRRMLKGTAFECALKSQDTDMCEMMEKYFKLLPNGEEKMAEQAKNVFPEGAKKQLAEQKPYDFSVLLDVLKTSTNEEIQAALNKEYNGSTLNLRLEQFRYEFEKLSCSEKVFNPQHFLKAWQIYDEQFGSWDWPRRDLFWRQILGYTQRFAPVCLKQALRQGGWNLTEKNPPDKLERGTTIDNGITGNKISLLSLDEDPKCRLGFDFAFYSYYVAGWAKLGRVVGGGAPRGCYKTYVEQKHQACRTYAADNETPNIGLVCNPVK